MLGKVFILAIVTAQLNGQEYDFNDDDSIFTTKSPPESQFNVGCGHRNVNGLDGAKTVAAKDGEAKFGEFPWMVRIIAKSDNSNKCGGSLIHPSVVLTAAHCIYDSRASELKIRAGEWDCTTNFKSYPYEDRDVEKIKIHDYYLNGPLYNDIALLFLAGRPLVLAANINTICLPPQDHVFDSNIRCLVSGWGRNAQGTEENYQNALKRVDVPIMPQATCQANLRTTRLNVRFFLHPSFVCAGGEEGRDVCKGDGGSPLMCPINPGAEDRYFQAGVVSWGIGCGGKNIPGVYSRVSRFRNWIDQQFENNHLDAKFYMP